jgi:hypothetical protein
MDRGPCLICPLRTMRRALASDRRRASEDSATGTRNRVDLAVLRGLGLLVALFMLLAGLTASATEVSVSQVVAEFAAQLPVEAPEHRLRFVAIDASGRTEPFDIRRERVELATKKFAEGI